MLHRPSLRVGTKPATTPTSHSPTWPSRVSLSITQHQTPVLLLRLLAYVRASLVDQSSTRDLRQAKEAMKIRGTPKMVPIPWLHNW